jgi:hypothetical protein
MEPGSPAAILEDCIDQVGSACKNKQIIHISRVFTNTQKDIYGIHATFVVCPDEVATELNEKLAQTVHEFFRGKGIALLN